MTKDLPQDSKSETSTEVYCPFTETVHSAGENCSGYHMEWWKAPDWAEMDGGRFGKARYCRRCGYVQNCRCSWCGRCNKVTGNNTQGHYWAYCKVTGTNRDFHFCCPDDCQLETE
jgi:hypothetical protein